MDFSFLESWQLKFLFCLMPKSFPLPDLPSCSSKTYACTKKFDFWKSGCFPNAFNSTEDMKYCTESFGKPTISGMKIPSVNDWAHGTVWVIKMLCRTELKILIGLSVRHCLKEVLGLDSGSNIECRHYSELLLRLEGGRYHVQYLVSLLFSSIFILAVPAEELFIAYLSHPRGSADGLIGCWGIVWLLWFVF